MRFRPKTTALAVMTGLLLLAAISCGPFLANVPIATPTPVAVAERLTVTLPTPTSSPQPTSTPTITPSHTPTASPTVTATPQPSATPTPVRANSLVEKAGTPLASAEIEAAACFGDGELLLTTFFSPIQNRDRNVRVYLPPCYGNDRYNYPVLYMFHGSPQSDATWDEVLELDESAENLIKQRKIPPMIIVMPDGRPLSQSSSGGPGSFEDVVINELVPFVEETFCAARRRQHRAIGGVSRGGYWATEIAFRHAERFGSVGAHSVAFLDEGENPAINPLYTGTANDLDGLRIYFDFGRDDSLINFAIPLHRRMLALDVPHEWVVHDFGGHTESYWISQTEAYLQWYAEPWPFERRIYGRCQ